MINNSGPTRSFVGKHMAASPLPHSGHSIEAQHFLADLGQVGGQTVSSLLLLECLQTHNDRFLLLQSICLAARNAIVANRMAAQARPRQNPTQTPGAPKLAGWARNIPPPNPTPQ